MTSATIALLFNFEGERIETSLKWQIWCSRHESYLHSNDSINEEHHHNKDSDIRDSLERAENKNEDIEVEEGIR